MISVEAGAAHGRIANAIIIKILIRSDIRYMVQ